MKTTSSGLASTLLCTAALLAALAPVQARTSCAPARPDAREAAFDPETLFPQGSLELSATGRARLSAYARALEQDAVLEVIVITMQPAVDVPGVDAREAAQRRAAAMRRHLGNQGVPPSRIYTDVGHRSRLPIEPEALAAASEPVVIEAVGAWARQSGARVSCTALG